MNILRENGALRRSQIECENASSISSVQKVTSPPGLSRDERVVLLLSDLTEFCKRAVEIVPKCVKSSSDFCILYFFNVYYFTTG